MSPLQMCPCYVDDNGMIVMCPMHKAAPDLLEALQRLFEWERSFWDVQPKAEQMGLPEIEFPESSGYMDSWLEKNIDGPVKAALNKALGEEATYAP